jgi:hypothetical protein
LNGEEQPGKIFESSSAGRVWTRPAYYLATPPPPIISRRSF